jgi:hypothetical protein
MENNSNIKWERKVKIKMKKGDDTKELRQEAYKIFDSERSEEREYTRGEMAERSRFAADYAVNKLQRQKKSEEKEATSGQTSNLSRLSAKAFEAMSMAEATGRITQASGLGTPLERKYVRRELPNIARVIGVKSRYAYHISGDDVVIERISQ